MSAADGKSQPGAHTASEEVRHERADAAVANSSSATGSSAETAIG